MDEAEYTPTELGAAIGRSATAVEGYLAGRWRPSVAALGAMAEVLDKPTDCFFAPAGPEHRGVPPRGRRGRRSGAPPPTSEIAETFAGAA